MLCKAQPPVQLLTCFYSTRVNNLLHFPSVVSKVNPAVKASMEESNLHPRKHPGCFHVGCVGVPLQLRRALLTTIANGGFNVRHMASLGKQLAEDLRRRQPPWSKEQIELKRRELASRIMQDEKFREADGIEEAQLAKRRDASLTKRMKDAVYQWTPIKYLSQEECAVYCSARLAQDYAILRRVLKEIQLRDPEFLPRSVLDFGSGVGSVFWVCQEYWSDVKEHVLVDISADMNEFAQLLIRGGDEDGSPVHRGVFCRQFLSSGRQSRTYDLVISAFTLMELPSEEERLRVIQTLWEKAGRYLVLIENGSYSGNSCVLSARDFILSGGSEIARNETTEILESMGIDVAVMKEIVGRKDLWESQKLALLQEKVKGVKIPTLLEKGHVFAPCPHDMVCPRQALNDPIQCHFQVRYMPLSLTDREEGQSSNTKFSFVIMKKGNPPPITERWPRIIRETLLRHNHVHARLCSPRGTLEEIIATKAKTDKLAYKITRKSQWGDTLPIETELKTESPLQDSADTFESKREAVN